jgi:DNA-binding GntR family transcriptional regulator
MAKVSRTIADEVFNHIARDILSGSLRPKDQISERELVARFDASRTPVREALKRLHERGLLTFGAKGVAVIRDMSREEIEELYSMRLRLERTAAILTIKNITEDEIQQLKKVSRRFPAAVKARDLSDMLSIRAEFHAILANATRNRWLARTLIMLRENAYVVRHAHWQDPQRAAQTIDTHAQMIACLEARNGAKFGNLVVGHVREALELYRNRLVALPSERRPVAPRQRRAS